MHRVETSNQSLLSNHLIALMLLAFGMVISLSADANEQSAQKASQISIVKRKESVFQTVDKLRKAKGSDIKAFGTITGQNFKCLSTYMYVSEKKTDNDITSFELPFNKDYKILYAELSINPNLPITLGDVQKRFGKWERLSKSKGNAEEKILPQYRYYYDHDSLSFNFRSSNHTTLTSITVYCDH